MNAAKRADRPPLWAAFLVPDNLDILGRAMRDDETECSRELLALSVIDGCKARVNSLRNTMRQLSWQLTAPQAQGTNAQPLSTQLTPPPDAIVNRGLLQQLLVPPGYTVDDAGVWKVSTTPQAGPTRICQSPVFMVGRTVDADGRIGRKLVWRSDQGWTYRTVSRRTVLDTRKILELSDYGLSVSSDSSKKLVAFLERYDELNRASYPATRSSHHLGWQEQGGFLLPGAFYVGAEDDIGEVIIEAGQGARELDGGLATAGTYPDWLAAIDALKGHPLPFVALYASCAAPLLDILQQSAFVVDFNGETSQGKSTSLRLAASVWGRPEDDFPTCFHSWNMTPVWIEQTCGYLHSLPIILDETKKARNQEEVSQIIYEFASGHGRGRGAKLGGVTKTQTWRTIMISSGEGPLSEMSRHAGVRARVLSITGSPLGKGGGATAEYLREALARNYGWFGQRVIEYLMAIQVDWDQIRSMWAQTRDRYLMSSTGAVSRRHCASLAVLAVAAQICHHLGMPRPEKDPLELLLARLDVVDERADIPTRAVMDIVSWCSAHSDRFWGRHIPGERHLSWLGLWEKGAGYRYIWVICAELETKLKFMKYDPPEILDRWAGRNWLAKRGARCRKKINGAPVVCYGIRREALEAGRLEAEVEAPRPASDNWFASDSPHDS